MIGTSTLLYKSNKKVSDPCCEMFEKLNYYKNSTEGVVYMKKLQIMNMEDKSNYINDLNILEYKEEEKFNIAKEFDRTNSWLEEIKDKLK